MKKQPGRLPQIPTTLTGRLGLKGITFISNEGVGNESKSTAKM